MIEHTPFLLLLGSVFVKKNEPVEYAWKPGSRDVYDLRKELEKFPKESREVVNYRNGDPFSITKNFYPFELYMEKNGIISFDEMGQIQVISVENYRRASETYALHHWMEEKDQEKLFAQFPDEKTAHKEKVAKLFTELRSVMVGKTV